MTLNLLVIRTANPKKIAEFYTTLGFTFDYHQHGNGPFHYSTDIGPTVFEIYPLLKIQEKPDTSLRLGFDVQHLDKLLIVLKEAKVEIVKNPVQSEWGYFAIIKDPDGRKIELKETAINKR